MVDQRGGYNVDEALLSVGFGKYQILVCLYAGMGWISEAMEVMILSFIGPAVKSKWELDSNQESLLTIVVFCGMLVGAYMWGVISDKLGRRKGFIVTAFVTSTAGLLSAFAWNYTVLLVARCLVGVGLGGGPVLFAWYLEFIPATNRGLWMIIFYAFWTVGTIFEVALAWIVMPRLGWRWLLALSAVPSLALLVFYPLTPESPRYLCLKGRKDDARKIMEKMAKLNKKQLPPGVLLTDREIELQRHVLNPTLLMLLSPRLIRSTLLLWLIFFSNAFSYYGLVLLTTQLNRDSHCNSNVASKDKSGGSRVNYKNVFITTLAECPGLVISALMVDRIGRRISMASMFFVCIVFMLPLVVHRSPIVTTILLFGARICVTGTFSVASLMAPELYPTSVRSTGYGMADCVSRIGGMVCPVVAVKLMESCHQLEALLLFVGVFVVAIISVLLIPYETKGRQLTESISSQIQDKQQHQQA
ncbi:Organic cation/carnitine transporter 7 [Linum perenne]